MEDVFDHPHLRRSEALAFEAEQAERRGDDALACSRYADAAELDFRVALSLSGLPRTRSAVAISAVCLFARARQFDRAVDAAKRFLA